MRIRPVVFVAMSIVTLTGAAVPGIGAGEASGIDAVAGRETVGDRNQVQWIGQETGMRQIVGINAAGDVVGSKVVWGAPYVQQSIAFFRRGKTELTLPLIDGYTNVEAYSLSSNNTAVGVAGRAPRFPKGGLQALIWDLRTQKSDGLGWPPGYNGSCALDVTADGSLITGYLTGANPPRILPCTWEFTDDSWQCKPLPTPRPYNPFVQASRVVVSDDGTKIAACVLDEPESDAGTTFTNQLCLWQRRPDHTWHRTRLLPRAGRLANINNAGTVVGRCTMTTGTVDGRRASRDRAFVYEPLGGFQLLDLLPGDESSAATDVNNCGTVVGYSDDPYGPDGGSEAFVWSGGRLSRLDLPREYSFSAATAINDEGLTAGYAERVPPEGGARITRAFAIRLDQLTAPGADGGPTDASTRQTKIN